MTRLLVIKNNYEFSSVFKRGKFSSARTVTVSYKKTSRPAVRYGVTVGKKSGGAVVRNRLKRLLREAWRSYAEQVQVRGYDLIFVAKTAGGLPSYREIHRDMGKVLQRIGLLTPGREHNKFEKEA